MRTHVAVLLILAGLVPPVAAQTVEILNYHDTDAAAGSPGISSPNFVRDAALLVPNANLTVAGTMADFKSQFDTGGWDVVIVSCWNVVAGTTGLDAGVLDRCVAHDAAGLPVILNAWHAETFATHAFFTTTVPTTFGSPYSVALPLFTWDPTHDLWTNPNPVSTLVPVGTTYPFGTDGQHADPDVGSVAVAGYAGFSPSAGNAGVIVGPTGAIFNSFTPQQYSQPVMVDLLVNEILYNLSRPACTIGAPAAGSTVSGNVLVTFDGDDPEGDPVDSTLEFSIDAGVTWSTATVTAASPLANPDLARATPFTGVSFEWDSVLDAVGLVTPQTTELQIAMTDGASSGGCSLSLTVDNVVPSPTCTLLLPPGVLSGPVVVDVDAASPSASTVDVTVEWSDDGGTTWTLASTTAGSPNPNPVAGVPVGTISFTWDSRGDGIGLAGLQPGVVIRATVDDGIAPLAGTCQEVADVENTQICPGICGDCDLNGLGPAITDALVAAQVAAGLVTPSVAQTGCCDVDASMSLTIVDALRIAQDSAGLPSTLICP